jgi:DNA-binding transcriptional regulator YiaG
MSADIIRLSTGKVVKSKRQRLSAQEKLELRRARAKEGAAYNQAFAQRIKRVRKLLGISEREAARAWQMTPRTYRRWEGGKPTPRMDTRLFNFVETYGIDMDWLVGGDEYGSPPRFRLRRVV